MLLVGSILLPPTAWFLDLQASYSLVGPQTASPAKNQRAPK